MHGEGGVACEFCDLDRFRGSRLFVADEEAFFACDAFGSAQVLPGSGIICPRAHRETPFDLTPDEWSATHRLMGKAKSAIDQLFRPDGYNLIWNVKPDAGQEVAHVHLHVIPRFHDEPYAGRGARWWLKQVENLRPEAEAPGLGRASS